MYCEEGRGTPFLFQDEMMMMMMLSLMTTMMLMSQVSTPLLTPSLTTDSVTSFPAAIQSSRRLNQAVPLTNCCPWPARTWVGMMMCKLWRNLPLNYVTLVHMNVLNLLTHHPSMRPKTMLHKDPIQLPFQLCLRW